MEISPVEDKAGDILSDAVLGNELYEKAESKYFLHPDRGKTGVAFICSAYCKASIFTQS
jgi:hypothetical protein